MPCVKRRKWRMGHKKVHKLNDAGCAWHNLMIATKYMLCGALSLSLSLHLRSCRRIEYLLDALLSSLFDICREHQRTTLNGVNRQSNYHFVCTFCNCFRARVCSQRFPFHFCNYKERKRAREQETRAKGDWKNGARNIVFMFLLHNLAEQHQQHWKQCVGAHLLVIPHNVINKKHMQHQKKPNYIDKFASKIRKKAGASE